MGETLEEYDCHTQLVERVLPANRQRLHNGVRGLAQALWRRRRLFGSRVHRETLSFFGGGEGAENKFRWKYSIVQFGTA